ncbi:MAG: hypothetical protein JWO15_151 [Sphingomonadales bacterium]|nr:hypothetical protein [Sphingomonadales bacterium]
MPTKFMRGLLHAAPIDKFLKGLVLSCQPAAQCAGGHPHRGRNPFLVEDVRAEPPVYFGLYSQFDTHRATFLGKVAV